MAVRSAPITTITGLGEKFGEKLQNLGIRTKLDLALHLPTRYQDRTTFTSLDSISIGEEYFVQGMITQVQNRTDRNELLVEFADDGGHAYLRLLHFSPYQVRKFHIGHWLRIYGQLRPRRQFIHPDYLVFEEDPGPPEPYYHPVYRTTKGISSNRLAVWIQNSLDELNFLPKQSHSGLTLPDAIRTVHNPDPTAKLTDVARARDRIAFDEMLAFTLLQRKMNRELRQNEAIPITRQSDLTEQFIRSLHFDLTGSQTKVMTEVHEDMSKAVAMRRLLQGDVGSGKTAIAVLAALRAAENHLQTAVMAPTELLAEQHYETFSEWLAPLGINVSLVTSRMGLRARRISQDAISRGENLIAIGTHALFQSAVQFKNLGLAVVDEQHRFGVHQRMQLRGKGNNPHQLIMTATPIPRTLALTMFADMDISTIDEMPKGRPPVHTSIHSTAKRQDVIDAVYKQLKQDRQVYWVCAAIEDNEESPLQATETVFDELTHRLPSISLGHIHGRMKTDQKSDIMRKFRDGEIQLLVSTTVIEVGIDVPNASIMIIENADHLGLAQLHQLRGRIGRGSIESFCMLIYTTPLGDTAGERLRAVRDHRDGFKLAELDFAIRGHGQVFGTEQSGTEHFKTADTLQFIAHHQEIAEVANKLIQADDTLSQAIIDTWTSSEPGYVAV